MIEVTEIPLVNWQREELNRLRASAKRSWKGAEPTLIPPEVREYKSYLFQVAASLGIMDVLNLFSSEYEVAQYERLVLPKISFSSNRPQYLRDQVASSTYIIDFTTGDHNGDIAGIMAEDVSVCSNTLASVVDAMAWIRRFQFRKYTELFKSVGPPSNWKYWPEPVKMLHPDLTDWQAGNEWIKSQHVMSANYWEVKCHYFETYKLIQDWEQALSDISKVRRLLYILSTTVGGWDIRSVPHF